MCISAGRGSETEELQDQLAVLALETTSYTSSCVAVICAHALLARLHSGRVCGAEHVILPTRSLNLFPTDPDTTRLDLISPFGTGSDISYDQHHGGILHTEI